MLDKLKSFNFVKILNKNTMSDKELKELVASLAIAQRETAEQMKQANEKMAASRAEVDARMAASRAEVDKQIKQIGRAHV